MESTETCNGPQPAVLPVNVSISSTKVKRVPTIILLAQWHLWQQNVYCSAVNGRPARVCKSHVTCTTGIVIIKYIIFLLLIQFNWFKYSDTTANEDNSFRNHIR